jgi:hypothetical protein
MPRRLLESLRPEEIDADRGGYAAVGCKVCRGIGMVSDLTPIESRTPGCIVMDATLPGWRPGFYAPDSRDRLIAILTGLDWSTYATGGGRDDAAARLVAANVLAQA